MMKREKKVYSIFVLLVLIQLLTIMYSFQFRKEGIHVDEPWSYGYANSFYTREIFMDDNKSLINMNQWISGEHLRDYLMVNEGEQFRFDSVYYNKENDISPFLHSMILHAICSFFPETFSWWYSFSINIVSFLVCMIFLFKIARMLKGDTFAIWCCALYGFSLAARDTFIYLRMYAMSTAIIMAYIYFTLKYVKDVREGKKPLFTLLLPLIIITWIGFLTNFYNISLVGIITFFVCVFLLCNKKIKQMFAYGFSMLGTLGAAVICMPNVFMKTASYGSDVSGTVEYFTFSMKMKLFLNFFLKKFFNVVISIYPSPLLKILAGVLVYVFILLIPVIVLVRREPFFKRWMEKIKYVLCHKRETFIRFVVWVNWTYVILFAAVLLQILVTAKTSKVEIMGIYEDRYIFFLYPIAALLFFACVHSVIQKLLKRDKVKKYILAVLALVLIGLNMYSRYTFSLYLFPKEAEGQSITEAVEGKNCIFVSKDITRVISISSELMYCNSYFQTSSDEYLNYRDEYMEKLSEGELLLAVCEEDFQTMETMESILGVSVADQNENMAGNEVVHTPYEELLEFFESLVPESQMQELGKENVFTKNIKLYSINP